MTQPASQARSSGSPYYSRSPFQIPQTINNAAAHLPTLTAGSHGAIPGTVQTGGRTFFTQAQIAAMLLPKSNTGTNSAAGGSDLHVSEPALVSRRNRLQQMRQKDVPGKRKPRIWKDTTKKVSRTELKRSLATSGGTVDDLRNFTIGKGLKFVAANVADPLNTPLSNVTVLFAANAYSKKLMELRECVHAFITPNTRFITTRPEPCVDLYNLTDHCEVVNPHYKTFQLNNLHGTLDPLLDAYDGQPIFIEMSLDEWGAWSDYHDKHDGPIKYPLVFVFDDELPPFPQEPGPVTAKPGDQSGLVVPAVLGGMAATVAAIFAGVWGRAKAGICCVKASEEEDGDDASGQDLHDVNTDSSGAQSSELPASPEESSSVV